MKTIITSDINPHYEYTEAEIEKMNADHDYIRKYKDEDDPTKAARRYRIRKYVEKIEVWKDYHGSTAVIGKDKYSKMKPADIIKELENKYDNPKV